MLKFLIIIFLLLLVVSFIFLGKKLIGYKATDEDKNEENIFGELKDIKSIKINIISAKEFYSHYFGGLLIFIACYVMVCLIGTIIGNSGIGQGSIESALFFPFYFGCFCIYFWYYPFFKNGIAPNLKYGQRILKKLHRLIFITGIFIILPIWISATIHFMKADDGSKMGSMLPGFFIGFFLFLIIPSFVINFELRRLGIPNLFEGIKGLMKNNMRK